MYYSNEDLVNFYVRYKADASPSVSDPIRIQVDIRMTNGLHVFQKNLSYRRLLALVENPEVLC